MRQETARERAERFIKEATQFRLGKLLTESPHPVTRELSQTAKRSIPEALALLFRADGDVVRKYREWSESDAPARIASVTTERLTAGGRIFFTGCGSTGRLSIQLDSIWRDFWQRVGAGGRGDIPARAAQKWEDRTRSVMAGGDYALIKAVEGFEDFRRFGEKQIEDLGVSERDVVFAITEGGETSFVIGTAWKALEKGAKVYFVYNNPDDILCENVLRSREVIQESRIEKINLTTGPMSITGSTRMQATSIQLCVLLTILEMVIREIVRREKWTESGLSAEAVPRVFLEALEKAHLTLSSAEIREQLAGIVEMEQRVYESGHKNTYFADKLAIDVLTDTTERSPTYCVPAFRQFDDLEADESWSFLFLPYKDTATAWKQLLKRPLSAISWSREEIISLVGDEMAARQEEIIQRIGKDEILRFRIGLDGMPYRPTNPGDSVVCIVTDEEIDMLAEPEGFYRRQLEAARANGAETGLIFLGPKGSPEQSPGGAVGRATDFVTYSGLLSAWVIVPLPATDFLLDPVKRITAKLLLNALSTCTLVRMGRVLGNFMIWVVPSNLKLIDRSTRYISYLTGLSYDDACRLLFEVIEYVEPRWKKGKEYPPPVGVAVLRAKRGIGNEEAERLLKEGALHD